jgi:hypothetical protein
MRYRHLMAQTEFSRDLLIGHCRRTPSPEFDACRGVKCPQHQAAGRGHEADFTSSARRHVRITIPGMGVRKTYEPHCPAFDCSGGSSRRLHCTTAEAQHLTAEVLERLKPNDEIFRCSYWQFVWFQRSSSRPGFDPTPVGYYDNFRWPGLFQAVSTAFRVSRENTRAFWADYKRLRSRRERRH